MNKTQLEIIGVVFGFIYSAPGTGELFLKYLAPIILKNDSNPTISLLIAILAALVFIASLMGILAIIRNIKKKLNMSRYQKEFNEYMIKNIITLVAAIILALFLKAKFPLY
jgi:hypothetical protein